jgi:YggT family protein
MFTGLLAYAIYLFCDFIVTLIVIEAIMSWFVMSMPYQIRRIYGFIQTLTEPFLRPFRRLLQKFTYRMGIDFSPIIAIMAIQLIGRLLSNILIGLRF